jgi:hypothetical protein
VKATITDIEFLIEAIQQKSDTLIEQLQQEAKQEILRGFTQHIEEQLKPAPKRRGRPPLKKTVRRTRK